MASFRYEGSTGSGEGNCLVRPIGLPSNRDGSPVLSCATKGLLSDCFEMAEKWLWQRAKDESPGNRFSLAISGAWKMVGATGIEPVTPTMST